MVLDGGREEVVFNSCFEDLEGRVGLKRVWEFVPSSDRANSGIVYSKGGEKEE